MGIRMWMCIREVGEDVCIWEVGEDVCIWELGEGVYLGQVMEVTADNFTWAMSAQYTDQQLQHMLPVFLFGKFCNMKLTIHHKVNGPRSGGRGGGFL